MLSRKSFAAGVPAVSMDELAAFANSYGPRSRRADGSLEARAGGRFEHAETRAHGGLFADGPPEGYSSEGYSPERYFGARSRSREPPADAERAWTPEDTPLPRLVSRPPACEPPGRGGSLETPARRGAPYYAWSPPATYRARAPRGDEEDAPDDTLPPYSERELSRGPSQRGRDLSVQGSSEKRRKKEPAKKPVRPRRQGSPDAGGARGRSRASAWFPTPSLLHIHGAQFSFHPRKRPRRKAAAALPEQPRCSPLGQGHSFGKLVEVTETFRSGAGNGAVHT